MKISIGVNLRKSNDFDKFVDPIGYQVEPSTYWNIPCENNEATLIKVEIDYVHHTHIHSYMDLLISKLRLDGRLILVGQNLNEINRLYFLDEIDTMRFNQLVYANDTEPFKRGVYNPSFLKEYLSQKGLKLYKSQLDNITYYLEFVRESIRN